MIPTEAHVIVRKDGRGAGNGEFGKFPKIVQSRGEKMKKLVVSIGACLLLTCGFGVAKDTTFKGEIMDEACADDGGHESMYKKMGTNDPKVCTEACIKGGSKYVLFNADKTFYKLSDQKKPASFAGQKVEVTGTLNKATKTIHVTDIKAAS
jgi:hypothetical protein